MWDSKGCISLRKKGHNGYFKYKEGKLGVLSNNGDCK